MSTVPDAEQEEQASWSFVNTSDAQERRRIHACNRILLYARGLELDARAGLLLATESLRRAGDATDLETILGHMHDILDEKGIHHHLTALDGSPLGSCPPIRRSSMVSDCGDCHSFLTWIWQGMTRICRSAFVWISPWKTRKTPRT